MPPAITPASAIVVLSDWMHVHQRTPTAADCRAGNGLNHYSTYCRLWGGLSHAVSMAKEALSGGSALPSTANIRQPQTRPCHHCGKPIAKQGAHIRHCSTCRKTLFAQGRACEEEYTELPQPVKQDYRETWEELLDIAVIHCR